MVKRQLIIDVIDTTIRRFASQATSLRNDGSRFEDGSARPRQR